MKFKIAKNLLVKIRYCFLERNRNLYARAVQFLTAAHLHTKQSGGAENYLDNPWFCYINNLTGSLSFLILLFIPANINSRLKETPTNNPASHWVSSKTSTHKNSPPPANAFSLRPRCVASGQPKGLRQTKGHASGRAFPSAMLVSHK